MSLIDNINNLNCLLGQMSKLTELTTEWKSLWVSIVCQIQQRSSTGKKKTIYYTIHKEIVERNDSQLEINYENEGHSLLDQSLKINTVRQLFSSILYAYKLPSIKLYSLLIS